MPAGFSWIEYNATAGDTHNITPSNLNFGSTNAAALPPSTYPITAGSQSYEKWVKGNWTGTNITRIENIQFWCSNSGTGYVTGESIICNATTGTWTQLSYTTPIGGSVTSTLGANALLFADPATANIGIGGNLAGSLVNSAGGASDFILLQTKVTSAASAGAVQQKTFTLQYDEV